MASVSTPYGFKPVRMIGNRVVGGAMPTNQYRILQNYTYPIPYGTPVSLSTATTFLNAGALSSATYSGTTATIVFSGAQTGLFAGMPITVSGITGATALNGTFVVTSASVGSDSAGYTTFTYTTPTTPTGTPVYSAVTVTGAAGFVVPAASTFATNGTAQNYIGIFVGCQYTNFATGQPAWDQWYPGAMDSPGMVAYVVDDPDAVFAIQASALNFDALGAIGYSYGLTTVTAGQGTTTPTLTGYAGPSGTNYLNVKTKDSNMVLNVAGGTATTAPFKIVDIGQTPDNANASGFVDVYVTVQKATHLFTKAL